MLKGKDAMNAFDRPYDHNMRQFMKFPTMWYVRPAKHQISLRIRAVWSEPLLVSWVATDWTPFGVSKLKWRLQRLVRVYTCQNNKLLEISCRGSIIVLIFFAERCRGRHMSRDMRFPKMWYVRPAKAQTSLRIPAVWSEHLLVTWIFYDC